MRKKNRLFKDVFIVLVISFGMLILIESVLRIFFYGKVTNSGIFKSTAYEFNVDYLISLKSNIVKYFTRRKENGNYQIRWETNNDSFRGPSLRENPTYRVIVYGDSNIHARFSGHARTFTGQLTKFLQDSISDVEVINAGVVGFGPDQSLIRFSKEVDKYKPNLVIFHIFADNDFGDIIRNRLYKLDVNGNLARTEFDLTKDPELLLGHRSKKFISKLLIVRGSKKAISLFAKAKSNENLIDTNEELGMSLNQKREDKLFRLLKLVEEEYSVYKESQPKKFSHFADHYDIDIALNPNEKSSKIKIRLMEGILKEASELASAKDVGFMVLIQPSEIDTTVANATLNYEYLRKKFPSYKRTNLTDAVNKACVSHGIHLINLFNVFIENNPQDLFFLPGDSHWNDRGQQLAAKETSQYIINNSLLAKKDI